LTSEKGPEERKVGAVADVIALSIRSLDRALHSSEFSSQSTHGSQIPSADQTLTQPQLSTVNLAD